MNKSDELKFLQMDVDHCIERIVESYGDLQKLTEGTQQYELKQDEMYKRCLEMEGPLSCYFVQHYLE